ncbi:MAG TPA: hypothetical protein VFW60_02625 [Rhodanobacteraceae bacterium]|nr:hypothetical protein [Rhodanobacteraceae bacterium]
MTDAQIIKSAYADALNKLFTVFFDALVTSGGNAQADAVAANHFKHGIALARVARDRALKFVK